MNRRMNLKYSLKQEPEDNRLRDHWQTQEKTSRSKGEIQQHTQNPHLASTRHEDSKLILYQGPGLEPEPRSAEEQSLTAG